MTTIVGIVLLLVLFPLTVLALYQWLLAVSSFFYHPPKPNAGVRQARFLVLLPADNEEVGIASTLESLRDLNYSSERYRVLVIADRAIVRESHVRKVRCRGS